MRTSLFLATFFLTIIISCGSTFGQKYRTRDAEYFPKHEIYVQYGAPTIIELTSTLISPANNNKVELVPRNAVFSGVGGLGYNLSLTERFSVGIYGGISLASADIYSTTDENETLQYRSHIINYTGQISAHWMYYEDGPIQISSGVYAGLNYRDNTTTIISDIPKEDIPKIEVLEFAYHLTVLKVRYGNVLGGFAELGFGYRGLVNVGLSLKL